MIVGMSIAVISAWCIFGLCHALHRFDRSIKVPNPRKYLIVLLSEGPLVWIGVPFLNLVEYCIVRICPIFKKFEDWYRE